MNLERILVIVENSFGEENNIVFVGDPEASDYATKMKAFISSLEMNENIASYRIYKVEKPIKETLNFPPIMADPTEHGCSQIWPKEYGWIDSEVMSKWVY